MQPICTLTDLIPGQAARVTALTLSGGHRRRLQDMGLIEGTQVVCLHKSPWGDPVAFWIRGAVIALRREDARCVQIVRTSAG